MTLPIVVVDDTDVDRYLVRRVVKSLGIDAKIIEFTDGEDFVQAIRERSQLQAELGAPPPPILVLLDVNMPRMGGFEVLETLKAELAEIDQLLVVTMYSSSNYAEDRADALNYDFVQDYILKPVTAEKFQALLTKLKLA